MSALGLSGWLLATVGVSVAILLRLQLVRHLESVARACHELRGPLTTVQLGLELGARNAHPPPPRLRAIELELGRATLALEDLSGLRVTRRQPRTTCARREPVDMAELVADCVEAWRASTPAHGARIQLQRGGSGLRVIGERLRLAQAVGNLIANAVEHGGGEVTVALRAERGLIRVEVRDEGPGLPAAIDELTVRRRSGARRAGGFERGHGLAIASAIAVGHGGRLSAAPSERGARLLLSLPAATGAAAA